MYGVMTAICEGCTPNPTYIIFRVKSDLPKPFQSQRTNQLLNPILDYSGFILVTPTPFIIITI